MGEFFDQLPEQVKDHVKGIAKEIKDDAALERVSEVWLEKKAAFEKKIAEMNMEEVDSISADEEKGAIALTYSGSLVNLGPLVEGKRKISYASIGMRTSVPGNVEGDDAVLQSDVETDSPINFSSGPVKATSSIFKIAVVKDELEPEEEEAKLAETTVMLEEDFVEINKTVMV